MDLIRLTMGAVTSSRSVERLISARTSRSVASLPQHQEHRVLGTRGSEGDQLVVISTFKRAATAGLTAVAIVDTAATAAQVQPATYSLRVEQTASPSIVNATGQDTAAATCRVNQGN